MRCNFYCKKNFYPVNVLNSLIFIKVSEEKVRKREKRVIHWRPTEAKRGKDS